VTFIVEGAVLSPAVNMSGANSDVQGLTVTAAESADTWSTDATVIQARAGVVRARDVRCVRGEGNPRQLTRAPQSGLYQIQSISILAGKSLARGAGSQSG